MHQKSFFCEFNVFVIELVNLFLFVLIILVNSITYHSGFKYFFVAALSATDRAQSIEIVTAHFAY